MKDLKFRAWFKPDFDTEDGPLIFFQDVRNDELVFAMQKDPEIAFPFQIPFLDDDWIVEEFTGLVDKKGVKVFEGDIVTLWLGNYPVGSGKFLIKFQRASFVLEEIEIDGVAGIVFPEYRPSDNPSYKNTQSLWDYNGSVLEVIGNVHQNKDLLK